jgi:hypothetical protein
VNNEPFQPRVGQFFKARVCNTRTWVFKMLAPDRCDEVAHIGDDGNIWKAGPPVGFRYVTGGVVRFYKHDSPCQELSEEESFEVHLLLLEV